MRRHLRTRRVWILAPVVLMLAAIAGSLGMAAWEVSRHLDRARGGLPSNVLRRGVAPRAGDELNVLVIGVDRTSSGDGVQVVRSSGTGPLRVLSIPRDLLLDAHDGGERPATIFHQQGPAALIRAVSRTIDAPIHRILVIRLTAMRDAVDAVGPISVTNPSRLETREIEGREWEFPTGKVELDGRAAEAFMRARHNEADPTESDEDRSRRQQLVLTGLIRSISPTDVLLHPRALPKALLGKAATNLDMSELVQLARAARAGSPIRCQLDGEPRAVSTGDRDLPWRARRDGIFVVSNEDDVASTIERWEHGSSADCSD